MKIIVNKETKCPFDKAELDDIYCEWMHECLLLKKDKKTFCSVKRPTWCPLNKEPIVIELHKELKENEA